MARMKASSSSDHLTMRLFAPGMTLLHRAGLGGLACTLRAMERAYRAGLLRADRLPAPFDGDRPPWEIDDQSVTLRFGKPENAGPYLERLFAFAFDIGDDGLIRLPGQYLDVEPQAAALADLQSGLTLTFLQHGRVRSLAKDLTVVSYDPQGEGGPGLTVEYKACSEYKHQNGWKTLTDKKGVLVTSPITVDGPISPGSVVRHVAYTTDTGIEDPPDRMLPLYFALVGCLALPINRGVAVLVVPDVTDLTEFVWDRPAMTPTTATECQIAGAADAALRSQARMRRNPRRAAEVALRTRNMMASTEIPGCCAMTFMPTPWASQQKSRVATINVPPGDDRVLDRYELAAAHLPARVVCRTIKQSTGRGRQRTEVERRESFRVDSIVRPLVAENLALGRPWYSGFAKLMTRINPASGKPYRDQLSFERGGLHAMISEDAMWDAEGERIVVKAVHEALRGRYAQIAEENKSSPGTMRNRFSGEYDRWRLAFAGAKTPDQFRKALCDLFSRAGRNSVLQKQWQDVLPMLRMSNWQHARDLALLGLCSYQGRGVTETEPQASDFN